MPVSVWPSSQELADRDRKLPALDAPRLLEVEQDEVRRRADRDPRALEPEGSRRAGAHPLEHRLERDKPGADEARVESREGGLEAGDPEGRLLERHVLLVPRVGSVVCRDRADRAVAERLDQGAPVLLGTQRRVHLHVRIERAHGLVGQAEVVRRHLSGGPNSRCARAPELVDRLARRHVQQVERTALVPGQREVPGHHRRLGDGRPAAEAELGRHEPLVHVPTAGERRILLVQRDRRAGDRPVLERPAHERCRHDRPAVVREARGAALGQLDHLRKLAPVLALRDRGEEPDRHPRVHPRSLDQRPEDGGRVDDGLGVRHRQDRAEPAGGGGLRPRGDVLLVLAPGRPQMDVGIDERGRQHEA